MKPSGGGGRLLNSYHFLNEYLKQFYTDPNVRNFMPVAVHEFFLLKQLEPYGIAPKALGLEKDCIYMSFEGNSIIRSEQVITRSEYIKQAKNILHIFHTLGIRHNDLLPRNVLIRDWTIKVIDFTMADYGKIDMVSALPNKSWAYLNQDYKLLLYKNYFPNQLSGNDINIARNTYADIAASVYNYHNLGVGNFSADEPEKTPHGYGERYNFDRMSMMVMEFDFQSKNVVDLGCNSGWFSFQASLLGAKNVIGVDFELEGKMGQSIRYAKAFAQYLQTPVHIIDQNLETIDLTWLAYNYKIQSFDAVFIMSVLHHIHDKKRLMENIFNNTSQVIFYEDHEFWNEMYDDNNKLIDVSGEGYRYEWNKDLSWRDRISSLQRHEPLVLNAFFNSWRRDTLLLDKYSKIKLLGFSEKRRPLLALYK